MISNSALISLNKKTQVWKTSTCVFEKVIMKCTVIYSITMVCFGLPNELA